MSVESDIKEAKTKDERSVRVRASDGKFICTFNIESQGKNGMEWYDYEKVFDSLEDFNEYIESFFKQ